MIIRRHNRRVSTSIFHIFIIISIIIKSSQFVVGFRSSSLHSPSTRFRADPHRLTHVLTSLSNLLTTTSTSSPYYKYRESNPTSLFQERYSHTKHLSKAFTSTTLNMSTNVKDETDLTTSSSSSSTEEDFEDNDAPLLTFGVIADIQTAPIPDGFSFGGKPRYYRHSLDAASHAAKHFEQEKVSLVINLGDIIDGKCNCVEEHGGKRITISKDNEEGDTDTGLAEDAAMGQIVMKSVVETLSTYTHGPILHTYGNHELYCMKREQIGETLSIPFVKEDNGELVGYYSYTVPCSSSSKHSEFNIKFVVLDSYDISVEGRCPDQSIKRRKADEILRARNPNYPELMNSPEGLEGVNKRFVAFNGAIDDPQKEWLRSTLQQSREKGNERVIILSHQPLFPASSSPVCLVWNYEEILDILREYKDIVCASFAGHAHRGGYNRDEDEDRGGIHFRVFEAMLESNYPVNTYGFCDVYHDRLVVRGEGDCKSAEYLLDHLSVPQVQSCED